MITNLILCRHAIDSDHGTERLSFVSTVELSDMGLAYFIMGLTGSIDQVSSVWGPLICVGLVTFITASILPSLLDEAVMGMMTSLAVDIHEAHADDV